MSRFVASVNIFVEPSEKDQIVDALTKLDDIEAVYEVKGACDIVSIVSSPSLEDFRNLLQKKIMKLKGVKSTITTVILLKHQKTHQLGIVKPL